MLSKDFSILLESFEKAGSRENHLYGVQRYVCRSVTGSKGNDKNHLAGAMDKAVNEGLHSGLSPPSGNWTGCLRSMLLPALFSECC